MTIKQTKTVRTAARAKRRRPAAAKVARARSSDAGDITSKPMLIGYARVSTVDQNLALQRDALTEADLNRAPPRGFPGAALSLYPRRANREHARSLRRRSVILPFRAVNQALPGSMAQIHPCRAGKSRQCDRCFSR